MKKLVLFACISVLVACSRDALQESSSSPSIPEAVETYGTLDLEAAVSVTLDQGEDSARSLDLEMGDFDGNGKRDDIKYTIDLSKYGEGEVHLFAKRKRGDVTHIKAKAKITSGSSGKYHMRIEQGDVPLKGAGTGTDEWYITGYWLGDSEGSYDESKKTYRLPDVAPVSSASASEKVRMAIPLGFPWTKVVAQRTGSEYLLKSNSLKIQPLGVVLAITPENRTQEEIVLERIDSELFGYAIGGDFDLGQEPKEGAFPDFRSSSADNTNNKTTNILPQSIKLGSGAKATKPIYLWVMPESKSADDGSVLSVSFVSRERTTMDASLNAKDKFSENGEGKLTDRYPIDIFFDHKPKHSSYYIKKTKIRTSPMITEIFANRVANGAKRRTGPKENDYITGPPGISGSNNKTSLLWRDPYFYGYVEIYNPNLDDILLEHYALARIANIRTVYAGVRGPNYPYFHPFGDQKFDYAYNASQKGTADRNADGTTESHKALLLSLQLKNNEKSSFQPNSLGFSSPFETASKQMERKLESIPDNDNRIEHVHFFKGGLTAGRAILKGGHTMILLGNGFLRQGDASGDTFWEKQSNGTYRNLGRKYQHKDNTLAQIADNRIIPLPKKAYDDMMSNPKCQMIVAVDNYKTGDKEAYTNKAGAGVMNLGFNDALFLVQKHAKDGRFRRVVDATSAHPFSRKNNWKEFAEKVTLAREREVSRAHYRVRTVAQHYPEFLNFSEAHWYPVLHESQDRVPEKVSPGRRSAADRPY